MRLIFILGSNVVIWVSDNLRTRLIFIFFLIRENVGNSFYVWKEFLLVRLLRHVGLISKGYMYKKRIRLMFASDNGSGQSSGCGRRRIFLDTILCYRLLWAEIQTGYLSFWHVHDWKEFFFLYLKKSDRDLIPFFSLEFLYVPLRRADGALSSFGY